MCCTTLGHIKEGSTRHLFPLVKLLVEYFNCYTLPNPLTQELRVNICSELLKR